MYEIMVEDNFSAAHRLKGYKGKCEELHGHNWKVQAFLKGRKLDKSGLLFDFKKLKGALKEIVQRLDHHYLNEISPFERLNPTSENLAHFIFRELKKNFTKTQFKVSKVTVWEGNSASASYTEI